MEKDNPQDWKAATDPTTGRTYWYHRKTRVSTWTKPDILREVELAAAATINPQPNVPAQPSNTQINQARPSTSGTNTSAAVNVARPQPATTTTTTATTTAAANKINYKQPEENRFIPTYTTNDHAQLKRIYQSLFQQKTVDTLGSRSAMLLIQDLIEFILKSLDQSANIRALECLWKVSSIEELQLTIMSSESPWMLLGNYLQKLPNSNSFATLLLNLIVCNITIPTGADTSISFEFIELFYLSSMQYLMGMMNISTKQLSIRNFSNEEIPIALDPNTLSTIFAGIRKGHLLPAVALVIISVQSISVEKYTTILVSNGMLPFLQLICTNKQYPEELTNAGTWCLQLLVSASSYVRDRLIEGYLGLICDTNTFPVPIVHPSNQSDEIENNSSKKHNYLPDNLSWTFLHSDDESLINSLKRDIEWIPTSGTSWRLPSALLWSRCPALRELIQDFWSHGGESLELSIDASEEVVANISHYIHTGLIILPFTFPIQCEMLRVSTQLQMLPMQLQVEDAMMANISVENAMILLEFCEHFQYISLAERCIALVEGAHAQAQSGATNSDPTTGISLLDIGYQGVGRDRNGSYTDDDANRHLKNAIAESLQDVNELLKTTSNVSSRSSSVDPVKRDVQKSSQPTNTGSVRPVPNPSAAQTSSMYTQEDHHDDSVSPQQQFHPQQGLGTASGSGGGGGAGKLKSGGIYTLLLKQNKGAANTGGGGGGMPGFEETRQMPIDFMDDVYYEESQSAAVTTTSNNKKAPIPSSAKKPSVAAKGKGDVLAAGNGVMIHEYQRDMSLKPSKPKTDSEKRLEEMSRPRATTAVKKPITNKDKEKEKDKEKDQAKEVPKDPEPSSSAKQSTRPLSSSAGGGSGVSRMHSTGSSMGSQEDDTTTASNNSSTVAASTANKQPGSVSTPTRRKSASSTTQSITSKQTTVASESDDQPFSDTRRITDDRMTGNKGSMPTTNKTNTEDQDNSGANTVRSSLALLKTKKSMGATRLATLNNKIASGNLPPSGPSGSNQDEDEMDEESEYIQPANRNAGAYASQSTGYESAMGRSTGGNAGANRGHGNTTGNNYNNIPKSAGFGRTKQNQSYGHSNIEEEESDEELYHPKVNNTTVNSSMKTSHVQQQAQQPPNRPDNTATSVGNQLQGNANRNSAPNRNNPRFEYAEEEDEDNEEDDDLNESDFQNYHSEMNAFNNKKQQPFDAGVNAGPQDLVPCPDCGRSFAPESFQKHAKICKKVFASRRRVFDSSKKRIEGIPELKTLVEQQKRTKGKKPAAPETQASKWKEQSKQFREAMRAAREYAQAKESGNLNTYLANNSAANAAKEPYIDPSLKQCPNCLRRFSEKAAERHFPLCKKIIAQPTMLKKGGGTTASLNTTKRR